MHLLTMHIVCFDQVLHVMHLRELIKEKTGIPTHQQRLTVGNTVLEDWDEEGRIMHLRNYPAIHDGATIYLVQLTTGIKFKTTSYTPKSSSSKNVPYKMCTNENENRQYAYVNIPDIYVSHSMHECIYRIYVYVTGAYSLVVERE